MVEYEIKSENRGLIYYENIKAGNILEALGKFYSSFGYQRVMQIRVVD